jgi:crossover junction endodeoxyribonuclease RuvC
MNTIIAIDPSLTSTGVVVLRNSEVLAKAVIETDPTKGAQAEMKRLNFIIDRIFELVAKWHDKEMIGVMEAPAFSYSNQGTNALIGLNYLIRDRFLDWKITLIIAAPTTLKKYASGKGNAKKDQMRLSAYKRWSFEDRDDNIIDAYCLARLAETYLTQCGTKEQLETVNKVEIIKPE